MQVESDDVDREDVGQEGQAALHMEEEDVEEPVVEKEEKEPKKKATPRKSFDPVVSEDVGNGRSKRERKPVVVYNPVIPGPVRSSGADNIASGSGVTLGDYDYFVASLEKKKGDDEVVKALHNLLFNSVGKKLETKKHLRQFSGFPEDAKIEEKRGKVLQAKTKWTVALLKDALGMFGLEKGGTREELAGRLVDYLAKPEAIKSGKPVSGAKRKRSSTKGKKAKKSKGPKKPPTAFILFGNSVRDEIRQKNPDASFGEIGKLIGQAWNDASDDVKQVRLYYTAPKIVADMVEFRNGRIRPLRGEEEQVVRVMLNKIVNRATNHHRLPLVAVPAVLLAFRIRRALTMKRKRERNLLPHQPPLPTMMKKKREAPLLP
jgi:hypothetical protein